MREAPLGGDLRSPVPGSFGKRDRASVAEQHLSRILLARRFEPGAGFGIHQPGELAGYEPRDLAPSRIPAIGAKLDELKLEAAAGELLDPASRPLPIEPGHFGALKHGVRVPGQKIAELHTEIHLSQGANAFDGHDDAGIVAIREIGDDIAQCLGFFGVETGGDQITVNIRPRVEVSFGREAAFEEEGRATCPGQPVGPDRPAGVWPGAVEQQDRRPHGVLVFLEVRVAGSAVGVGERQKECPSSRESLAWNRLS